MFRARNAKKEDAYVGSTSFFELESESNSARAQKPTYGTTRIGGDVNAIIADPRARAVRLDAIRAPESTSGPGPDDRGAPRRCARERGLHAPARASFR